MINILISCISLFTEKKLKEYLDENKEPFEYSAENITISAYQTNEACIKFILKKLNSSEKKLDYYFRLETNGVQNDEHTMKYLDNKIQEFCSSEAIYTPKNEEFFLGEDEKEHRYDRVLSEIAAKVMNIYANEDNFINIYLDVAGGKRDNFIFIQLLTKLLSFYNFRIHSYYAEYSDGKGTIVNTDISFRQMKLLDASNEFVRTGSATSLCNLFKTSKEKPVKYLLKVMKEFGDAVLLCSTDLTDIVFRLTEQLDKTEKEISNNEEGLYIIKTLIPLIRNSMNIETENKNLAILSLINWCLKNNLIQQALTIFNENAIKIIFKNKMIEIEKNRFADDINQMKAKNKKFRQDGTKEYLVAVLNKTFYNIYKSERISDNTLKNIIGKYKNKDPEDYNNYHIYERTVASLFFCEEYIPQGVKVNIDFRLFRRILTDRYYFSYARNRVNHALGPDEIHASYIYSLPIYPFSSYSNFNPNKLSTDLDRAVRNLSEGLDYLQSHEK